MRVLIAAGDEEARIAQALELASSLAAGGVEALVLAGARGTGEPRIERAANSVRIVRVDPAPGHWQRSRSIDVARLVRTVLADLRIELLHVVEARGLTHDLVATAASIGVPSVVELASPAYACLVEDRVRRDAPGACVAALGPMPCLACAEADPAHGPTPWVPIEARFLGVAERRRDALRELELARFVLVEGEHAIDAARRALDSDLARIRWRVVAGSNDAAGIAHVHAEARAAAHELEPPRASEWWVERMHTQAESAWDAAFERARGRA